MSINILLFIIIYHNFLVLFKEKSKEEDRIFGQKIIWINFLPLAQCISQRTPTLPTSSTDYGSPVQLLSIVICNKFYHLFFSQKKKKNLYPLWDLHPNYWKISLVQEAFPSKLINMVRQKFSQLISIHYNYFNLNKHCPVLVNICHKNNTSNDFIYK